MKGPFPLIKDGIGILQSLFNKRDFWYAYLICFGAFDIFFALCQVYPEDLGVFDPFLLFAPAVIVCFFNALILILLSNEKAMSRETGFKDGCRILGVNVLSGFYTGLGYICLIIPGIILSIRYMYVAETVVYENQLEHSALRRSRNLSNVNGGKLFVAHLIIYCGYFLFFFAIEFILYLVSGTVFDGLRLVFNYFIAVIGTLTAALIRTTSISAYIEAGSELVKD